MAAKLMRAARFFTDFADAAVILPLAGFVLVALLLCGRAQLAGAWAAAIAAVLASMAALKLGGYAVDLLGLSPLLARIDLVTPSGHTAAAAAAYGGLAALLVRGEGRRLPIALGTAALVGAVVGVSRIALRDHSLAECVVGALVGMAGAGLAAVLAGGGTAPRLALGLAAAAAVLLFHGAHFTLEPEIKGLTVRAVRALSAQDDRSPAAPSAASIQKRKPTSLVAMVASGN